MADTLGPFGQRGWAAARAALIPTWAKTHHGPEGPPVTGNGTLKRT